MPAFDQPSAVLRRVGRARAARSRRCRARRPCRKGRLALLPSCAPSWQALFAPEPAAGGVRPAFCLFAHPPSLAFGPLRRCTTRQPDAFRNLALPRGCTTPGLLRIRACRRLLAVSGAVRCRRAPADFSEYRAERSFWSHVSREPWGLLHSQAVSHSSSHAMPAREDLHPTCEHPRERTPQSVPGSRSSPGGRIAGVQTDSASNEREL